VRDKLRGSTSRRGAGGGMNIPLPAAQRLVVNTFDVGFPDYSTLGKKIRHFLCAAGPAPSARGRRPLSCSALREPSAAKQPVPSPRLVSLRHSGSPAVCLRGSGNLRLPKAYVFGHALFPFAAQGAGTLWLRLRACLPSLAAEPPASSPCDPRSPSVSAGILFVIPAKAGIRGLRFASLYHSRNAVSPSMFTIGERCHSDGVLPASARQNDEESLHGLVNRNAKFRPG